MSDTWLFLSTPWMKGPAVRRWQEMLLQAKYILSDGADGTFGPETAKRTREAQAWLGVDIDGVVGGKTLQALEDKLSLDAKTVKLIPPELTVIDGVEVWDYRGKVAHPSNTGSQGMRPWSQIEGIVLHRTACVLGENPQRYFPVNAHIGVTLGGKIILPHKWELMIWHGHSPSPWTIGIEFDGNGLGVKNYWWKPGGPVNPITDAQIKASTVLLDLLLKAFDAGGSKLKYIVAHRQSSKDRECDPGIEAWQKIALVWMEKTGAIPGPRVGHPPTDGLALPVGYAGDTWSDGAQIPHEWDQRSLITFWK